MSHPEAHGAAEQRRVLFLGTPFFDYYLHIIEAFRGHGFEVDYYNDRPGENALLKGAIRLRPDLVDGIVDRYQRKIIDETRERHYDLIFVLNGKSFTPSFIKELRSSHPDAEAVLYLWDAISLYPFVLDFSHLFDRRYTFDAADAAANPSFTLWPLFYTDDFREVGENVHADQVDHDIINVCSAHANRYTLMKWLIPDLRARGMRVFSYLYLNPLQFAYNRVKVRAFARARPREFRFRPLAGPDYVDLLRRSAAVLDVNHVAQSGLTIRTIETLGARRKLITTNTDVATYDFYHPSRVLVIDADAPDLDAISEFIASPQVELDASTYHRYGVRQWVREMIGAGSAP